MHHLNPDIPDCRPREWRESIAALRDVLSLPLRDRPQTMQLALWDEERSRLIALSGSVTGS